jgi:hypothetical protein
MKKLLLCLLMMTTYAAWPQCVPVTITHATTDGVSPVNQSVTYQVVTGVPGELDKCWITSNLGANTQAATVADNSTASAGWYWQFNRIQGYQYDGTTVIPSQGWDNGIDENSDWTSDNDPCKLLGDGWRIPTFLEWMHVDNYWWNWTYAYGSKLKLHAAGNMYTNGTNFQNRGIRGSYWSSSQSIYSSYGRLLWFWSATSTISMVPKSMGLSVRCLK